MQLHRTPTLATYTLGAEGAGAAHSVGEHELATTVLEVAEDGADLVGRAHAGAGLSVDLKGRLGIAALVGARGHAGYQRAAGVGKLLACGPSAG